MFFHKDVRYSDSDKNQRKWLLGLSREKKLHNKKEKKLFPSNFAREKSFRFEMNRNLSYNEGLHET